MLGKFFDYLKTLQTEKENIGMKLDDLGFDINFGGYQPEKKASSKPIGKYEFKSKGHERKSFGGDQDEVPKEFIQKIKELGMKEEDADILYQTKIDWTAVYSENKIFCTETKCDFYTKIDNEVLTKHMINKHKYGEYPCLHPNCSFIGYSKVNILFFFIFSMRTSGESESPYRYAFKEVRKRVLVQMSENRL